MFYSTKDESILRDGVTQSHFPGRMKHNVVKIMNHFLKEETVNKENIYVTRTMKSMLSKKPFLVQPCSVMRLCLADIRMFYS